MRARRRACEISQILAKFWRNFECGARARALSGAQTASSTLYHGYMMCGACLGCQCLKTRRFYAVAYEISHVRADLIEIEMKLERVHTRVRALSGAQTAYSTI